MVYFGGFFPKLEFSRGFLYVCIIYRISAAVMVGDIILFGLAGPVGYSSVAQEGAAELRRMQRSSVRCNVAQ